MSHPVDFTDVTNTQLNSGYKDTGETNQGRTDNLNWWETQQRKE